MTRVVVTAIAALVLLGSTSSGDEPAREAEEFADLSAPRAVHEGNQRLTNGNAGGALDAYRHAEALEPEAREIAFVEGLAHFDLKEYDQAREAFRRAASLAGDSLADDALYSLGTCDHAEALANLDNPQLALSRLESAMGRYHEVLTRQPKHEAARGANLKAASMWRELKRQLEQQPPQQSDSCDNPQEKDGDDKEKEDQQPQQSEDQEQQEQQQERQQSEQEQEQEQDQQQQEQSESSEEQQQEESQEQQAQQSGEQQEQQDQQQAQARQQEQVSREQAERKLREMMQDMRDRKKMRRVPVEKMQVRPVDKDW